MSICSDVYISQEEARKRVKSLLMYEQGKIVELAIKGMQNWELTSYLNGDDSIYYYNIETVKKKKTKEVE